MVGGHPHKAELDCNVTVLSAFRLQLIAINRTVAILFNIFVITGSRNPSCSEIKDVLSAAGLNVLLENHMHPREWNRDAQFRGRVRVQLKQEDGSLCQDKFTSRKDVMFYVAEMIPKLKTRTQKSGGGDSNSQQADGGKKNKKKK
ncbi:signal recognition particle 19 kDa protein-like [Gadus chalcogrammus]|uniref:signal recognition particle 19 kDa protein-like n=1 Tax=Gadus chalcogrammus TaxID=1042646 RepID=UPI0024C3403A|nr:signal recognition particle 19 kDa protein-like [Gadus chalcogrammus]